MRISDCSSDVCSSDLPLELARTKPYAYALFNLDVLAASAWLLGGRELIGWKTADGRSIGGAIAWMAPYIADKAKWPLPPDIEYWDGFPVRQPSLLFCGLAQQRADWLALWQRLDPDPVMREGVRNFRSEERRVGKEGVH